MYRILVVEDEDDIQKILENYLIDQGYAVTLAYDGVDGIAKFHNGEFDLVLLDVMMPKIDGFGVCELIRRESNVPIIMLTALDEEAYQIKGFDKSGFQSRLQLFWNFLSEFLFDPRLFFPSILLKIMSFFSFNFINLKLLFPHNCIVGKSFSFYKLLIIYCTVLTLL